MNLLDAGVGNVFAKTLNRLMVGKTFLVFNNLEMDILVCAAVPAIDEEIEQLQRVHSLAAYHRLKALREVRRYLMECRPLEDV